MLALSLAALLIGCTPKDEDTADTGGDTADTSDTADSGTDTADSADSGTDTADTADSGTDTADSGIDTADSGTDTADTADSGGDTSDTGDSGGDTGDSGGDTGDSGGDTGDPDPDSGGDTASSCTGTAADLVWTAEVRDASGTAGTAFTPRDSLTMVGVVSNPCSVDIRFDTSCSTGFIDSMYTVASSGMGTGVASSCDGRRTTWTVAAGGQIEEGYPWGTLSADAYVLEVDFRYGSTSATQSFTVR